MQHTPRDVLHTPAEEHEHEHEHASSYRADHSEQALAGPTTSEQALTDRHEKTPTGPLGPPPPLTRRSGWSWNDDVCKRSLRLHLLVISFGTGLLDATTYSDFGIFASNQTGNTLILLTESIAASRPAALKDFSSTESPLLTVGVSLASFLVLGAVFGQLGNVFGRCRRAWLVGSTLVQALFLLLPAVLLQAGVFNLPPRGQGDEPTFAQRQLNDSLVIFLLASSAGIQVSMAKSVGVPETPSAMLTSPYADLITDPHLFARELTTKRVRSRNIRIAYIFSLASGTIIGAAVYYYRSNVVVIWVAFALRMANMAYLVIAPGAEEQSNKVAE